MEKLVGRETAMDVTWMVDGEGHGDGYEEGSFRTAFRAVTVYNCAVHGEFIREGHGLGSCVCKRCSDEDWDRWEEWRRECAEMHKVEQSVIQDEIDMGIGLDLALYFPDPSWSEERWQEYYREVEVIHRKTIERFPKIAEYIGSREPGLDQESLSFAIRRTVTLGGYEFSDSME